MKAGELSYVLGQARSSAHFHTEQFRGVDTGAVAREVAVPGIAQHSFDGWLETVRSTPIGGPPEVPPEHPAQIQYASGTTGHPKGALLHHMGLVTNAS